MSRTYSEKLSHYTIGRELIALRGDDGGLPKLDVLPGACAYRLRYNAAMNSKTKTKEPVHRNLNSISRLITRGLRHAPGILGVQLDAQGWVAVETLLAGLAERRRPLTHDELVQIVRENDKQRLTLSEDGKRVRAAQGHTVEVDLGLANCTPPALLYHGTVSKSLPAIRSEGLRPMKRHAVHLSSTVSTAFKVGERRGPPVILVIDAHRMALKGHRFSVSENGVWLAEAVPVQYIGFPAGK